MTDSNTLLIIPSLNEPWKGEHSSHGGNDLLLVPYINAGHPSDSFLSSGVVLNSVLAVDL